MEYKCNLCNKYYKTSQSLSNHKKNIHMNKLKKYYCKYCNKEFLYNQSMNRHINFNCKYKKSDDILLKIKMKELKLKDKELNIKDKELELKTLENKTKDKELTLKDKELALKEKALDFRIQNNINNTQINNTQINNNNNNNLNILQMGLDEIDISQKEKIDILKSIDYDEYPIVEMIKKIYNDDRFINCRNVAITDRKGKDALYYNPDRKKFEHTNKEEIINEMIVVRKVDIRNYLNELKDKKVISESTKKRIEEYVYKINNYQELFEKEMKEHNEQIAYTIYNQKDNMKEIIDTVNNQILIESDISEEELI